MGGGVSVGPAVYFGPGDISMKEDWVQGAPPHSHTQTSYAGTGTRDNTRHRARVALYNHLFARSIVALCSDVGGKIPLWGKGLNVYGKEKKFSLIINAWEHVIQNFTVSNMQNILCEPEPYV